MMTVLCLVAPKGQRALLSQLLLHANGTLSASTLIGAIWGSSPPQHPEAALHIVVCRLRRALDAVAPRLVRDRSGYRIELDVHECDLSLAQSHYADVSSFPFYDVASRRLREFQLEIVEHRNEAYLRCGRQVEVLKDVETWIAMEPWRERLRAHQMMAMYCAGRQIDALAAYEDLGRLLATDFGVEPHEDLQRLHHSILRQDPQLPASFAEVQSRYQPSVESLVGRLREIATSRPRPATRSGG